MSDSNNASGNNPAANPGATPDPKLQPAQPGITGTQPTAQPGGDPIKDAAAEAMRKFKVKVDGQELEVDEKELLRGYGHQRAANKALQEGKAYRKQAEEFVSMMKDPERLFEVIQKLGHDPRNLSEKYLSRVLEEEHMDPRDKELRDAKAKLKKVEDMERQQKEAVETRHREQMKAKYSEQYQTEFVKALQTSGLPPTKPMVAEMAKYISRAAGMDYKMTPTEAAQLVREDMQRAHMALIGDSDGETLIKLLGEDVANKVRKWDTSRVRSPEQQLKTPTEQAEPNQRGRSSGHRMSAKEWRDYNRKK